MLGLVRTNDWKLALQTLNVRARAPLRLGLAGGGTDLSPYCDRFGGAILNATIDRFAFAHVKESGDGRVTFRASDLNKEETFSALDALPLDSGLILHKAVYSHIVEHYLGGRRIPLLVSSSIDAPAGSGLGSSSALVVALVEAFRTALQLPLGPYDVARLAFQIERVELRLAGGRQDQYAAAFGGLNYIEFLDGDRVVVNPLRIRRDYLNEFESSLVICFTGQSRKSEIIIREQVKGLEDMKPETVESMHQLKQDALAMKQALLQGDVPGIAKILAHSWQAKRQTASSVATPAVEELFEAGMSNGALAGKVSGAGGGGFLMFCTDPENRVRLISALNAAGGVASPVKFTFEGAEGWNIRS
jgi:D-glycero-alpha-D-manno-heptose-7-phosphate kinase